MEKARIDKIFLRFEVDGDSLLAIMLAASGGISRQGNGTPEGKKMPLALGNSDKGFFDQAMQAFDEDWLELTGRYEMPNPRGKSCKLEIALSSGEEETGIGFVFGSQSEGPPEEIIDWIETVAEITDEWYDSKVSKKRN